MIGFALAVAHMDEFQKAHFGFFHGAIGERQTRRGRLRSISGYRTGLAVFIGGTVQLLLGIFRAAKGVCARLPQSENVCATVSLTDCRAMRGVACA